MPSNGRQLFDEIAADVAEAFDRVGGEIVDAKREDLGTPIGVTTGPRGGKIVIRSKEGEFPRKESGELQGGLESRVEVDGVAASLIINDPVPHAVFLQNKDRIVTSDIPDRFTEDVLDAVADAISGKT